KADPANAALFRKNGAEQASRLDQLAEEFRTKTKGFKNKRIVTVHEVFDYLANDCEMEIVGTIQSAPGREPSAGEMTRLANLLKEKKAAAVFTEPQYPHTDLIAKTLGKETGVPVYALDPVASGPKGKPTDIPADYYEVTMKKNLETLVKAFTAANK